MSCPSRWRTINRRKSRDACVSCSLRKGARLVTVGPHTGEEAVLFDPRRDAWLLHFRWDGVRVVGVTPTGRATVMALHMNRPLVLNPGGGSARTAADAG